MSSRGAAGMPDSSSRHSGGHVCDDGVAAAAAACVDGGRCGDDSTLTPHLSEPTCTTAATTTTTRALTSCPVAAHTRSTSTAAATASAHAAVMATTASPALSSQQQHTRNDDSHTSLPSSSPVNNNDNNSDSGGGSVAVCADARARCTSAKTATTAASGVVAEARKAGGEDKDSSSSCDCDGGSASSSSRHGGVVHALRRVVGIVVPYGGLLSCTCNLAATSLGAGIIAMPSGFNLSGVVLSVVYLLVLYVATVYSLHLLARVILKTGLRTYSDAAHHLLGRGADYFLASVIVVLSFGGSVAYIIATSTLLTPVLRTPGVPAYLQTRSGNRVATSVVWLCLMLPFVIPKRINSLRYFSAVGIVLIVYFVGCMVAHACTHGLRDAATRRDMAMMRSGNAALEGLGVFMFSFLCQMNAFEVMHEMRRPSARKLTAYGALSMGLCVLLYLLAGYFGYADFGRRVTDSVLTLYDPVREPYIAVAYVGLVVKICAAFTLHMQPFRDALYYFCRWNAATLPYWKHSLVMAVPTTLALLCGLFVPTLNTVLGLLGSFCGGTIGLIMPALFFMYSGRFTRRDVGTAHYVATYLLLVLGVVVVVFGTATTIYSTVGQSFA